MALVINNKNNEIAYKHIYLYTATHLPEKGWFQGCDYCGSITAHKILIFNTLYNGLSYNFYIFRCPKCKSKDVSYKNRYNLYIDDCIVYIKKEYSYLFN